MNFCGSVVRHICIYNCFFFLISLFHYEISPFISNNFFCPNVHFAWYYYSYTSLLWMCCMVYLFPLFFFFLIMIQKYYTLLSAHHCVFHYFTFILFMPLKLVYVPCRHNKVEFYLFYSV